MSSTAFHPAAEDCALAGPLSWAEPRHWHRVIEITGTAGCTQRLRDLGLVPGAKLFLASVGGHGAVVQLTGHGRLAVDAELAQAVWVETAE